MMPPLQIAERCARVRGRFDQAEALLISDLTNVRWLTGFTGSNGWLVLTPHEVVLKVHGALVKTLRMKATRDAFARLGAETLESSPEETSRYVKDDLAKWTRVVREAGIKLE